MHELDIVGGQQAHVIAGAHPQGQQAAGNAGGAIKELGKGAASFGEKPARRVAGDGARS
ncbi:hypothetical protein LP417_22435 [Polaromonas sp. P1-6]|nr:hypothetical protein LP417_22435 [Polaromonas sp. P1-6]